MPRQSTHFRPPSSSTSQDITFLTVNQPHSPDSLRARRGYQSCDNCRLKKKRCEPSSRRSVCGRCEQDSRVCLTTHPRKRRKLRPLVGNTMSDVPRDAEDLGISPARPSTGTLPHTSHTSAREDISRVDPGNHTPTPPGVAAISDDPYWGSNTNKRILSTSILDACDALDLIAVAGSKHSLHKDGLTMGDSHQSTGTASHESPSVRRASAPSLTSWGSFFLVKRGIIQPHEAIEYLNFYFERLWPLFPVIPQWYASADRYACLASEEPVLTTSLVTIASRYHRLSGLEGLARSERIHWRTWPWVRRLFQSSIWGSSAMRSLGAITGLLLFIEWHPRVINSPEDLIGDCGDVDLFEPLNQEPDSEEQNMAGPTDIYRRLDSSSIPERLNIIAPAYRSNKMSRMLLSTAISLAQEIGCLRDEQVLEHTSSRGVTERMFVRLEWTRNLRTFIRLTDEALALRLRQEPQLASNSYAEFDRISSALIADGFPEATVDLASHMCKARELLHGWRKSQQGTGPAVSITAWENFTRGLNTWKTKHYASGRDLSLRDICLYIEYYYIRLCGLSPATHTYESSPRVHPPNAYIRSLSQFAEETTQASVNMLELIVQFSSPSKPFKYAPVKCWLYIFCAALYLLKVTLKSNEHLDRSNQSITLITRVVETIKHNSPDDIHMSQRYAALLDIIVNAALRTSQDRGQNPTIQSSPLPPAHNTLFDSTELDLDGEWIFDSSFWNTLPDIVGLNGVPDLIMPPFE